LFCADRDVTLERAWIAVQVLARAELERVDEHGRHERPVWPADMASLAQQRPVTVVQRAHGRHQGYRRGQGRAGSSQPGQRPGQHRGHAGGPESAPSNSWASAAASVPAAIARSAVSRASARYAASVCGELALIASTWAATVCASPRATGPVSAASPSV